MTANPNPIKTEIVPHTDTTILTPRRSYGSSWEQRGLTRSKTSTETSARYMDQSPLRQRHSHPQKSRMRRACKRRTQDSVGLSPRARAGTRRPCGVRLTAVPPRRCGHAQGHEGLVMWRTSPRSHVTPPHSSLAQAPQPLGSYRTTAINNPHDVGRKSPRAVYSKHN